MGILGGLNEDVILKDGQEFNQVDVFFTSDIYGGTLDETIEFLVDLKEQHEGKKLYVDFDGCSKYVLLEVVDKKGE